MKGGRGERREAGTEEGEEREWKKQERKRGVAEREKEGGGREENERGWSPDWSHD